LPPPSRLLQNVSAEVGARVLYLATRFFIPPFVLNHIGIEAYGLYGAVFVLVSYFGMSAIGFSSAYVKFIAEFAVTGRHEKANRLLSSGFTIMSAVGTAGFAIFALAWPWIAAGMKVPAPLAGDAQVLAFLIVGIFFAYLALSVYRDALTGQQEIAVIQKVWIGSFLLETLLVFVLVGNGFGLRGLGIAFFIRTAVDLVAHYFLAHRHIPWLRVRFVRPDRESLRLLLNFGGIVQLNCMLSIFLNSIERVIATPLLGLSAAGLLDLGKRLPGMGTSIPSAFASSVYPAAAELHARSTDPAEAKARIAALYLSTTRLMSAISGVLFAFLTFAAAPCLLFWLGEIPAGAVELTVLFSLSSQVHMLTGPGTSIAKAIGRPRMEFHYSLANVLALCVLVPASRFVWSGWTVIGVAQACAAATMFSASWFLFRAHRNFGISPTTFLRQALLPGLLPYVTGALCLVPFSAWASTGGRSQALIALTTLGVVYLLATGVTLFVLCANEGERALVNQLLIRLRSNRRIAVEILKPQGQFTR